jgi:hypothetical protein
VVGDGDVDDGGKRGVEGGVCRCPWEWPAQVARATHPPDPRNREARQVRDGD